MSRDSILLLGGAGFIGTALARRLAVRGQRVHVISRKPPAHSEPGIVVHAGNLGDAVLLEKLLPECGTVVHLASTTTPGTSAAHPARESGNLASTLHLLEILQRRQDTHLIFLSSGGTVYGNPMRNPVSEHAPLAPRSYHGAAKVALEGFLQAFRASGHAVTVLRPSNAYGPGQSLHQGFGLVRTVLQNILRGSALEIWGDGKNVRDFVYVEDVVEAIVRVAAISNDSGTYNVGSGKGYTINQVLAIAQQVSGMQAHVEYRPARSVDVREVVLDIAHIQSAIGWQASVDLEQGMRHTWAWLLENPE
jgi:UDP-glucose 4-epimerase